MEARFGPRAPGPRRGLSDLLPPALRPWAAEKLLGSEWFARRVVVDGWFLHRDQPALTV